MKEFGKVKDYNGFYGNVIDENGEKYLLLKEQIIGKEKLINDDLVTFVPEVYEKNEIKEPIARLVKKYERKNK